MNKKLSLIILLLLFSSLISVLLAFLSFSSKDNKEDVDNLKNGYEQLSKQVSELKVTTDDLDEKITTSSNPIPSSSAVVPTNQIQQPSNTQTPAPTKPTKSVTADKVNMRSTANTTGQVIRQLSISENVTLTGQTMSSNGYQWSQITDSKGNTGWVVSTYLK